MSKPKSLCTDVRQLRDGLKGLECELKLVCEISSNDREEPRSEAYLDSKKI